MKLVVVVVLITSPIILSSAQPIPQCIETYNTTFNGTTTCGSAYLALLAGNVSEDQAMMVCYGDQQCNNMIENAINDCGDTVN